MQTGLLVRRFLEGGNDDRLLDVYVDETTDQ